MLFRAQLQDNIAANGGEYRGDLTKSVTHLIAMAPEGKKYEYAAQWNLKIVSLRWYKDCLERGMILNEDVYHPTVLADEQGKGAWNRTASARLQLGKRSRDDPPLQEAPRKLRRTASAKLGSQTEDMWGDIMSGGFDSRQKPELDAHAALPTSDLVPNLKPTVLESESFVLADSEETACPSDTLAPLPLRPKGYFEGGRYMVFGFPAQKKAKLQEVLDQNAGTVIESWDALAAGDIETSYVIVPHDLPRQGFPEIGGLPSYVHVVTEMWIERCLYRRGFLDPIEHPVNTPAHTQLIIGFGLLTINSTGFEGIELLHISRSVPLLGAKYSETLHPDVSVLVCNKTKPSQEKIHHALSWDVTVVSEGWLWACYRSGRKENFDRYRLGRRKLGDGSNGKNAQKKSNAQTVEEVRRQGEQDSTKTVTTAVSEICSAKKSALAKEVSELNRRTNSGPRDNMPGADFYDLGEKELSARDEEREADLPLQEINSNSPPQPATGRRKKPLFQSLDGNTSAPPSQAGQEDVAPSEPVATIPIKREHIPQHSESLNGAIYDLLKRKAQTKNTAASSDTSSPSKKKRLLGRAVSNMSNSSRHSRASSIGSENTDGVGSVIGTDPSQPVRPKSVSNARGASFTGKASAKSDQATPTFVDLGLSRDEHAEEEPAPQMTQLGYADSDDAILMREKLAEKRRARSRQGQESSIVQKDDKRIKDDDALLGTGWGAGRRTRHKDRSPEGMKGF